MKQVLLSNKQILVEDIPIPTPKKREVLVKTAFSLISTGTELSGKKKSEGSLAKKIISDPEKLRKAIDIIKKQGLNRALEVAESRKETKGFLGYSLAGVVVGTGDSVKEFKIDDRVACSGAGKANHAKFVCVPENLVVKIPENLDFQSASSVALGSIALQGLRRADVRIGENVAVIGLGLLGQILIQLLKVNGARVIGFDINDEKINLAKDLGINQAYSSLKNNILEKALKFSQERGVDSTIITASSPGNNGIIQQAMEITRKKGKVVVVGEIGLGPQRSPFYEKEIDYLISCSYGPGRYDSTYEEKGIDYPFSYVRWTEKRNMEEYIKLLAEKKINFQKLVSQSFFVEEASRAYQFLEEEKPIKPAVLLDYHFNEDKQIIKKVETAPFRTKKNVIRVGVIGAGGFAKLMHLPNLSKLPELYSIFAICDLDGVNAKNTADKFKANYCTTDYKDILNDQDIDMAIIALPHNLHAKVAMEAARSKKAVFCEKPVALNKDELKELENVLIETKVPYLVGFNRRFSPFAKKIKEVIENRENPLIVQYQMNSGFIPKGHWVQTEAGGGRNIGEACHIYDLFTYFTESQIDKVNAYSINPKREKYSKNDNFTVNLKFKDGSVCNLIYTAIGSEDYSKEQMKIYFDGKIIFLNDYSEMEVFGLKKEKSRIKQDKGHFNEIKEFAQKIKEGNGFPIPLWQMIQATEISFEVEKQIKE